MMNFTNKQEESRLYEYADRLKEYFSDKLIYLKSIDQYNSEYDEKKLH